MDKLCNDDTLCISVLTFPVTLRLTDTQIWYMGDKLTLADKSARLIHRRVLSRPLSGPHLAHIWPLSGSVLSSHATLHSSLSACLLYVGQKKVGDASHSWVRCQLLSGWIVLYRPKIILYHGSFQLAITDLFSSFTCISSLSFRFLPVTFWCRDARPWCEDCGHEGTSIPPILFNFN